MSDSSRSHAFDYDEDPKEIVQKILEEMKKSKEKDTVEDTEYVPSPEQSSDNSHESNNIPL